MGEDSNKLEKTLILESGSNDLPNILVVDDDENILILLADFLAGKNYLVDTVTTAEEAIKKLEECRYNLILLDVILPGMSGRDLLQYCIENHSGIGVIMITGAPELDAAVEFMKKGAFDYLSKPIDFTKLQERIKNVLKKRAAIRIDPILAPIMKSIPAEYNIVKVISTTDTSIILLVEKDDVYYAMKVLRYDFIDQQSAQKIKRFFREAKVMRSVNHPNIVKVYEYSFEEEKLPYILAEYVPNTSLSHEMIKKMTFDEKLKFIYKLAGALWEIHKNGICHRDLKLSNIMVTSAGEPKLTDFGIAGIKDSSLTMTTEILGSPRYMPPEAFLAFRKTDARSDIFSFGLVSYEILTENRPFSGNNINQIIHSITTERPVRPSVLKPQIPEELDDILARMLAKEPNDRYSNTASIAMDIEAVMAGKEINKPKKSPGFFASLFKKSKTKLLLEAWQQE